MTLEEIEKQERLIEIALNLINAAIEIATPAIYTEPETAVNTDVLGILVSKWTEWEGADIVRVAYSGLEDANNHELAEKIADLYKELTGNDPW